MLVVIPARGGSKGVPNKNIKLLGGKPLLEYTINVAREIFKDDQILISTDSEDIKCVAENLGLKVPFLRPPELGEDNIGMIDVIRHIVDYYESTQIFHKTLVLLQPTSPFRTGEQIAEALEIYESGNMEMLVSVKESKDNPYFNMREENSSGYLIKSKKSNYVRRQDCPKVWTINGAIYIIDIETIKFKSLNEISRVRKFEMDNVTSHDIDTMFDWELAEFYLQNLIK